MRRLLLLSLLLVFVVPGRAQAAEPCRNKIFNDWYADGKVASTYSHQCYVDALKHIPPDAAVYSNLSDDIKSAMRAAAQRAAGKTVPKEVGHGFASLTASSSGVAGAHATNPRRSDSHDRGTPQAVAPVASTGSSSSSIPVPILILGAVALLLAAAGVVGGGVRYARSRRR